MADTTAGAHVPITGVPALPPRPEAALVNPLTLMLGALWPDDLPRIHDMGVSRPLMAAAVQSDSAAEAFVRDAATISPRVADEAISLLANGTINGERGLALLELVRGQADQFDVDLNDAYAEGGGRDATHREGSWTAGVKWRPDGTTPLGDIQDPCAVAAIAVLPSPWAQQTSDVFELREYEPVTAFYASTAHNIDNARDRATRLLECTTSKKIATELWQGNQAAASQWSNPFLTRIEAVANTSPPLVKQIAAGASVAPIPALAALEQAIAQYGRGDRGIIHCSPRTLDLWVANRLIHGVQEGSTTGLLTTWRGNIVIPDAGYTGAPPAPLAAPGPFQPGGVGAGTAGNAGANTDTTGVTNWAYATGMVAVKVSEIETSNEPTRIGDIVDPINNEYGNAINRAADQLVIIAHRYAAYTFDPQILAGVKIDHSSTTAFSATLP